MSTTTEYASAAVAELNLVALTPECPCVFTYTSTDGSPRMSVAAGPHQPAVSGIRDVERAFGVDVESFTIVRHCSTIIDFQDEARIRDVHAAAAERLPRDAFGPDRVYVFHYAPRRRVAGKWDHHDGSRQPATSAHVDLDAASVPRRSRDLPPIEAGDPPRDLVEVINLSRSFQDQSHDAPAWVADAPSIQFLDSIPSALIYLIS